MKTQKVAIVYHFVPHYRQGFVKALDSSELFDVLWVASSDGVEGIKNLDITNFKKFKSVKNFWLRNFLFQPYVLMISLFGSFDAVVFLASPYFISTWLAAFICKLRGVRVIFWGHGPQKGVRKISIVEKIFYGIADAIYVYGYHGKINLIKIGINESKIYVGLNSLKLPDTFPSIHDRSSKKHNYPLKIVALSRLISACKYDQLLRAVAVCRDKYNISCEVTFIGDGECMRELVNLSNSLNINSKFMGAVYDEKIIASILLSSHCLAQPGKVGLSAMHALAYGLPVITHENFSQQMPEVEAIIPSVTGILHKMDDVEDLALKFVDFFVIFPDGNIVHENCINIIKKLYNPLYQVKVFGDCMLGMPTSKTASVKEIFEA